MGHLLWWFTMAYTHYEVTREIMKISWNATTNNMHVLNLLNDTVHTTTCTTQNEFKTSSWPAATPLPFRYFYHVGEKHRESVTWGTYNLPLTGNLGKLGARAAGIFSKNSKQQIILAINKDEFSVKFSLYILWKVRTITHNSRVEVPITMSVKALTGWSVGWIPSLKIRLRSRRVYNCISSTRIWIY